jgi:hypothetical protein
MNIPRFARPPSAFVPRRKTRAGDGREFIGFELQGTYHIAP